MSKVNLFEERTISNSAEFFAFADLCSLALNNVECVMDQEKTKGTSSASSPTAGSSKNSFKSQQRHHEHNYTNPSIEDTSITITKVCSLSEGSTVTGREGPRIRNSSRSQSKGDANEGNQRTTGTRVRRQPPEGVIRSIRNTERRNALQGSGSERTSEAKSKVIKKDVYNRIRRSEEELQKAAEMVRGGMTFQTASDTFNIPISTIR